MSAAETQALGKSPDRDGLQPAPAGGFKASHNGFRRAAWRFDSAFLNSLQTKTACLADMPFCQSSKNAAEVSALPKPA
jgi:hypothetical protein